MKKSVAFVLVICFLLACKKEKTDGPDNLDSDISLEYYDKAVILDEGLEDVIVFINEEDQVYTLRKAAFKNQPRAGEVILVPGKMMRKVKSVTVSGNNYVIETEDAALTEVVENGRFSFDIQPDWGDVSSIMIGGQQMMASGFKMKGKGGKMSISPIESNITVGGVNHAIRIEPKIENGRIISCTFRMLMSKGGSTSFEAVGVATLPSQKTEIVIRDGKLQTFNSNNKGLKADFKVQMATAGGESGEHSLKLPKMVISIPIRVIPSPTGPIPNPIPMSINVGIQFVSQMKIVDPMSSATGKSSVSFDADAGFSFKGAEINTTGALNKHDITEGVFDSGANIGLPIDLQFGLAFPRISLDIAGQEVAYVHVGYTTGSTLTWGPLCKRGYSKMLVEGGYSLKVFGQSLLSGKKTFAEFVKRAGDDCD